jgi:hypothetical protein
LSGGVDVAAWSDGNPSGTVGPATSQRGLRGTPRAPPLTGARGRHRVGSRRLRVCCRCLVKGGTRPSPRLLTPAGRSGPVGRLPGFVAARPGPGLAGQSPGPGAPTRPPGWGGTPPLSLEVRLDAVGAVVLDGLSYRRLGGWLGSPRPSSAIASRRCWARSPRSGLPARRHLRHQPGRAAATLDRDGHHRRGDLGGRACHPGQRPRSWFNQKVIYDAKGHTAQGLTVTTIHGELLWCDSRWPGSCDEHELLALSGSARCWTPPRSSPWSTAGFEGWRGP